MLAGISPASSAGGGTWADDDGAYPKGKQYRFIDGGPAAAGPTGANGTHFDISRVIPGESVRPYDRATPPAFPDWFTVTGSPVILTTAEGREIVGLQNSNGIFNPSLATQKLEPVPTLSNEDTASISSAWYEWRSNLDSGTRLQEWADSARSSALYGATTLYDTKMRLGYMDAIHESADAAVMRIKQLGPGNIGAVEQVARDASAFRDATRTATQMRLTPWGTKMSQMIEGTEKISFDQRVASREAKLAVSLGRAPTPFETLQGVAAGSGYSNKWVTRALHTQLEYSVLHSSHSTQLWPQAM